MLKIIIKKDLDYVTKLKSRILNNSYFIVGYTSNKA
jgi:hypothetical protein